MDHERQGASDIKEAIFKAEVEAWARRIGVTPREIRLRPMKRKWASCTGRGRITFNTELLEKPARFRAEVIIHELLHLKNLRHGKLFNALLKTYLAMVDDDPNGGENTGICCL